MGLILDVCLKPSTRQCRLTHWRKCELTKLPRILVLTASYGAGHELAAYAIKEYCCRYGLAHVQIIDLMKEAHPVLNKISTSVYMSSFHAARFGIHYYGWSYYLTQRNNAYSPVLAGLNRLGTKQLVEIIQREQPDGVINTFPYGASPIVSKLSIFQHSP